MLRPSTVNLIESILNDDCPSRQAMLDFGIETEWHFEALAYSVLGGDITPLQLDDALGDGEKLTDLAFKAPSNPHRFITFIMREGP